MREFTIEPLVGVGPITFGMTRNEAKAALARMGQRKAVARSRNTDCYFRNAFQVSYDRDDRVEFIETAQSTAFQVLFHGKTLHDLPAEEAVQFVSQFAKYDRKRPEQGYTYVFPNLQLSLWRAVLPSADGDDSAGRHFEAIGIGKKGYFN